MFMIQALKHNTKAPNVRILIAQVPCLNSMRYRFACRFQHAKFMAMVMPLGLAIGEHHTASIATPLDSCILRKNCYNCLYN